MKHIVLLLGCLLVMPTAIHAGELYRWVDKSGKVHYGDAPATEALQVERKKFSSPATQGDEDLPYETRLAQQHFPVMLYKASNCGEPCQQARDFLDKRGIPFTEKTLLTQEEIDDFKKQSGSDQSPTLAVGKAYLKGFQAEAWGSELDIAGYPKTAPYRAPRTPPAAASQVAPANPAAQ
ncbi:MAG: glutaredoxin family protein [Nitrosomonadales bacterium]|nr:glutaredoxin family protein [Nitrosomonadales bacterium]